MSRKFLVRNIMLRESQGSKSKTNSPEVIPTERLISYLRRCVEKAERCRSAGLTHTAKHFCREALETDAELEHRRLTCITNQTHDLGPRLLQLRQYLTGNPEPPERFRLIPGLKEPVQRSSYGTHKFN
jgi:hypothetical protein